jgi:DNA repair exonuclease SbcCD ATPase subunit
MKIQSIEISGFKSFTEYQNFNIPKDNGLYFVTGENQVEPELGANGAGKSALFEAICWCLYGKTSTNLKAGNIVNWNGKSCWVKILFDNNDTIFRSQSPNQLQINSNPVTQEELETYLGGLGFESFLYSTFISQFSSKFFDLSPADKMVVFSDIMAETLKPWELRSNQAKAKAVQMDVTIQNMNRTVATLQGNLDQLDSTDYSIQIKMFEDTKKAQLDNAKARLVELVEKENKAKADLQVAMKERAKLQVAERLFKSALDLKEFKELKDKKENLKALYYKAKSRYEFLEKELNKMQGTVKSGISTCPVCKQAVDKKHLKSEIDDYKKKMAAEERDYNDYGVELKTVETKIQNFETAIEREKKSIADREYELKTAQTEVKTITDKIDYTKIEISRQKTNIEDIKNTKNNYLDLEKERQANIKKFKSAIKDNEDLLGEAKKEFDAYTYWVKGFKEIRLLLMVEALKEFEVSINNNLSKFGLSDWLVRLDIDRETKSGSVRKGFSVLVCSPGHEDLVPMEVWSGGEGQRIRLAGTIGLMDLIKSKRQVDFGLEIFDEPTAWLSEKGIDDLCQFFYYRANEKETKIFLIDHKNLANFGGFHGIISIDKSEKGSQITV